MGGNSPILNLGELFNNPWTIIAPPTDCYSESILLFARNLFVIVLVALIVVAIVMVGLSGLRIVTSLGNSDQMGEGFAGIKNALLGIIFLIVILVVLAVIATIFLNNKQLLNCPPASTISQYNLNNGG